MKNNKSLKKIVPDMELLQEMETLEIKGGFSTLADPPLNLCIVNTYCDNTYCITNCASYCTPTECDYIIETKSSTETCM